jgi:hypothetical protein
MKTPRFNDDLIRRDDLPRDVFEIIHDLCYHVPSRDINSYVRRAQEALRKPASPSGIKSPFPKQLTWLVGTLIVAYRDKVTVLSMIGDFARLIVRRRKEPKLSSTTCICCGGWIPIDRENRNQHTCSKACHRWYRILMRAKQAARFCRYCGRPEKHAESIKRRRPGRPRLPLRVVPNDAGKNPGAVRHGYHIKPPRVPAGAIVPLIPNKRDGVDLGAVREALEES